MYAQSYLGLFGSRMIMLQCMARIDDGAGEAAGAFRGALPAGILEVCPMVTNSLVIENRWE